MEQKFANVKKNLEDEWDKNIVPALSEYITIPNISPDFDPEWQTNGLQEKAMDVLMKWLKAQPLKNTSIELVIEKGKTPFLLVEIAASEGDTTGKTCLMYGHMDKQPPLSLDEWSEGLHPYKAIIRGDKLYGRGGGDDGYAMFMSVAAVRLLQEQGIPHGRVVIMIEGCEESGSIDLPYYMERYKERIGDVDLIVCLDSGAANYDQLWVTTSLRGVIGGVMTVSTAKEGMHSGVAGGVVPDSFRIARLLLNRIEDPTTGEIALDALKVKVPAETRQELAALETMPFLTNFALLDGVQPEDHHGKTTTDLAVRNFWEPCLTVTGADLPPTATGGNVIRTESKLKLSVRLPPGVDADQATELVKKTLEADSPYGAKVSFHPEEPGNGWAAPLLQPWLKEALMKGSTEFFNKPYGGVGLGGSIPLMGDLGKLYPQAQFVVTGVLGPQSNAHGPDEMLNLTFTKGVNHAVCHVLAAHYQHHSQQ